MNVIICNMHGFTITISNTVTYKTYNV